MFHRQPVREPDRSTRVALRLEEWPKQDRDAWDRAQQEGEDIFAEAGLASRWRSATRQRVIAAYGRWLGELARLEPSALELTPIERVTRERITLFCSVLSETNSGVSVATHLRAIRDGLRVMAPEVDWGWLMDISRQIDHQSFPRPKANRVRTSDEIVALGRKLIERAEAANEFKGPSKETALDYRDGLMLLVLAYAPLRRKNLAGLEVGRTLIKAGDAWTITLLAKETKSRIDEEYALPVYVSRYIDRYLLIHRPTIFGSSTHNGFFASAKGRALPPDGAYQAICQRTLAEFGVEVNPHLIRDGAQTMWALENPKQIRASGALLGHADPKTGERHYNQAKSTSAARQLAAAIARRR